MPAPTVPPRNLSYIIARAAARFGRSDSTLEAQIPDDITDQLREICAEFDYWFLRVEPGMVVPAAMPYSVAPSSFALGRWLDQGWFLTADGTADYKLACTSDIAMPTTANTPWAYCEASRINYVKLFTLDGGFQKDLPVMSSDQYLSFTNFGGESVRGTPIKAFPYTQNEVTWLRLHPTPDTTYVMATSFQLAVPPWYSDGSSSYYNILSRYYPRVLQYLAFLAYADHHHETGLYDHYAKKLYGTNRGRVRSDIPDHGLIGAMRIDTMNRWSQQTSDLPTNTSIAEAVGRGEPGYTRDQGNYYTSPPNW